MLLDSPVLKDDGLDSRDRAIIVMLTGRFLARAALEQLRDPQSTDARGPGSDPFERRDLSKHGGPLKIGKVEWDTLVNHVEQRVFNDRLKKESEHVERMQEVLDDAGLSPLQKAVVEILVLRNSAT